MKTFNSIREETLEEKLKASDPTGKYIHDFVHSDNPKFAGKSKKERIRMALGASYGAKKTNEAKDSREYDYEGDMAKSQLRSIIVNAQTVHDMLEDNTNLAEWVQSKITLSADYISTVRDYMQSNKDVKEEVDQIDELKSATLTSYIDKVATGPSRGNKNIKAIGGVTTAIRKRAENDNPPFDPDPPKKNPSAVAGKYGIGPSTAAHLAKQGMKQQMKEEVKTTHEDPLVVTKDSDGNIHTHANLSVANAIHGTDVKHQAIHTGQPVQGGKFTFQLSKHHSSAIQGGR
jgi:hypothetical protein